MAVLPLTPPHDTVAGPRMPIAAELDRGDAEQVLPGLPMTGLPEGILGRGGARTARSRGRSVPEHSVEQAVVKGSIDFRFSSAAHTATYPSRACQPWSVLRQCSSGGARSTYAGSCAKWTTGSCRASRGLRTGLCP
jgi:hypothetical protein